VFDATPAAHYKHFAGGGKSKVSCAQFRPAKRQAGLDADIMTIAQRLPISVCLIAGNEATRIRRALDSVSGWAGEIIVVINDNVADGTDRIAESCGAKVFREPWKGHIAQKNSAARKAAQEWILGLDADEAVSPELRAEIQQLFAGSEERRRFAAYSFPRCTYYCGRWIRHGDWYPDRQIRLWRRGAAEWGGVDPHDKLIVQGRVGRMRSDLRHFSNESINRHLQKIIPFSDEFVRQHAATGQKAGVFDLAIRPVWRFLRAYFFRLGFLDGWPGYYIAWLNAFSTVTRYSKLREFDLNRASLR
jgi:glycosyltransferase involved in cell wall biosynthesis